MCCLPLTFQHSFALVAPLSWLDLFLCLCHDKHKLHQMLHYLTTHLPSNSQDIEVLKSHTQALSILPLYCNCLHLYPQILENEYTT